jgi:hypothetical protein
VGAGDRRDHRIEGIDRPSDTLPRGHDLTIEIGRARIERQDALAEALGKKRLDPPGQILAPTPAWQSAQAVVDLGQSDRGRRQLRQGPRAAMPSHGGPVPASSPPKPRWCRGRSGAEVRRLAGPDRRMRLECRTLVAEQRVGEVGETDGGWRSANGSTQNLPRLFLHRAAVPGGLHAQARLHAVIEVPDRQACHGTARDCVAVNVLNAGMSVNCQLSRVLIHRFSACGSC